jgi:hypothetical protein
MKRQNTCTRYPRTYISVLIKICHVFCLFLRLQYFFYMYTLMGNYKPAKGCINRSSEVRIMPLVGYKFSLAMICLSSLKRK